MTPVNVRHTPTMDTCICETCWNSIATAAHTGPHAAGPEVHFPPIPSFSPELFAYLRCAPNQKKAFNKGVEGLLGEGAVQVLYSNDDYVTDPILAAVGQLQFEVVQYRMKDEYGR